MGKLCVLGLATICVCFLRRGIVCSGDTHTIKCLESDRRALVDLKNGLIDTEHSFNMARGWLL